MHLNGTLSTINVICISSIAAYITTWPPLPTLLHIKGKNAIKSDISISYTNIRTRQGMWEEMVNISKKQNIHCFNLKINSFFSYQSNTFAYLIRGQPINGWTRMNEWLPPGNQPGYQKLDKFLYNLAFW